MVKKWTLRVVAAASLMTISGVVYGLVATGGSAKSAPSAAAYVCPLTGEELPCPNCCPLKR
ncbi:MAG TPA: hypothetical protein VMV10_15290 [Pirellulales bacterium]|nr:hypothetical protein [Pirellulales bacterium]